MSMNRFTSATPAIVFRSTASQWPPSKVHARRLPVGICSPFRVVTQNCRWPFFPQLLPSQHPDPLQLLPHAIFYRDPRFASPSRVCIPAIGGKRPPMFSSVFIRGSLNSGCGSLPSVSSVLSRGFGPSLCLGGSVVNSPLFLCFCGHFLVTSKTVQPTCNKESRSP